MQYKIRQQLKEDCDYTKYFYKNLDCFKNFVDETTYFVCNAACIKCKIKADTSCNSKNLICVAYCIKCMK